MIMQAFYHEILNEVILKTQQLCGYTYDTFYFKVFFIGSLIFLLLFGRWIAWAVGSKKGTFCNALGFLVPLIFGFSVYILMSHYVLAFIDSVELKAYIAKAVGGFVVLVVVFLGSPFFVGAGVLRSLYAFLLSLLLMWATTTFFRYGTRFFGEGEGNVRAATSIQREGTPKVLQETKRYVERYYENHFKKATPDEEKQ